jgi:hypothetical protein
MCHDVPAGKESVVRCDVPMQHVWGDSSTHARCIGVGSTTLYFFMDPINYHTHIGTTELSAVGNLCDGGRVKFGRPETSG